MEQGFLKRVYRVIHGADVVLEVCDARFPELTRNQGMEARVKRMDKKLIVVFNKADLVKTKMINQHKKKVQEAAVFLSAQKHQGIRKLRETIGKATRKKQVVIAVIGYPNTGKSSLINALKGKRVSKVSSKAGFTRGEQLVRVNKNTLLVDSPGIIPFKEHDPYKLVLVGAKNPQDLPDIELGGIKLIEHLSRFLPEKLEALFGEKKEGIPAEELLEMLALKWNKRGHRGKPNTHAAAQALLKKWQQGRV